MDVLARTDELTVAARRPAQRAPWQTRFADLPAVPRIGGSRHVAPIAIPVIGGTPINGRHLVRAPWAEPLAAFAGVIVETQLVPDAWVTPRSAARRAVEPHVTPSAPIVPQPRPYVAIPIRPEPAATLPRFLAAAAPVTTIPVRVVPVTAPGRIASSASMTALGRAHASVSPTSAAPIDPVAPSSVPTTPPPARRGRLGRAVVFAAGLVVSIVAAEAAARIGRR